MSANADSSAPVRYLALGDSYTLGVGASSKKKGFPTLLARSLAKKSGRLVDVENPSGNGFTTEDVIRRELSLVESFKPDVATILIGSNDVVQGRTQADYRQSIKWIYGVLVAVPRVAAISVPDWSTTPGAAQFGPPEMIRQKIEAFNGIAREEAAASGFLWVDLGDLSRKAATTQDWTAADGLHPADPQYAAWAEAIWAQLDPAWT